MQLFLIFATHNMRHFTRIMTQCNASIHVAKSQNWAAVSRHCLLNFDGTCCIIWVSILMGQVALLQERNLILMGQAVQMWVNFDG